MSTSSFIYQAILRNLSSVRGVWNRMVRTGLFSIGILLSLSLTFAPATYAETDADVEFSESELDQMLAPIALYPDTVLSQVLIASTYPIEIVQADRWAMSHKDVKGEDAVRLVEDKDWDPSVKALVAFPDILERMSDDIDWTQRVGDAFLSDENRVMDSVQKLRKKAYASGNLNKVEHLKVERDNDAIIIEPAQERVVYVPVYDTRVVYGNWWWADHPPVYWHYPSHYTRVSSFYWGPSIYIGPTYFYSSCHWHNRRVVVVDRHHHHSGAHFYTSRSISRYHGARDWRHNPVHRRGVAYYNNDLRRNYGSRHESYRDARVYRENHRGGNQTQNRDFEGRSNYDRFKNNPRVIHSQNERNNSNNNANNNTNRQQVNRQATDGLTAGRTTVNGPSTERQHVDRAEQLRARLNNQPNSRTHTTPNDLTRGRQGGERPVDNERDSRQQIDRGFTRANQNAVPTVHTNDAANLERTERAERFSRPTINERAPTTVNPSVERIEQQRTRNIDQNNQRSDVNNRPVRVDDSGSRRVQQEQRGSPRAERSNTDGNGRVERSR